MFSTSPGNAGMTKRREKESERRREERRRAKEKACSQQGRQPARRGDDGEKSWKSVE